MIVCIGIVLTVLSFFGGMGCGVKTGDGSWDQCPGKALFKISISVLVGTIGVYLIVVGQ